MVDHTNVGAIVSWKVAGNLGKSRDDYGIVVRGTIFTFRTWDAVAIGVPEPDQATLDQWEQEYLAHTQTPEFKLDRLSRSPSVQRADLAAIVRASRHYLTLPIDQKNKIQQLIDDGAQTIIDAIS